MSRRGRVKIVATIGPSSAEASVLEAMLRDGVDAVRINASHTEPRDVAGWPRPDWAVADAAVETAHKVGATAIVTITGSGRTARLVSAGRPSVPVFSFSTEPAVRRRVALMWGVIADTVRRIRTPDPLIHHILEHLRGAGRIRRGDRVVVVFGSPLWAEGTKTNSVRVVVV